MKIRCVKLGPSKMLTVGKIYIAVKQNLSSYFLENDFGVLCPYLKENFEEVKE